MEDFLEKFKSVLSSSEHPLILCHDFPDPDCLAAAGGLQYLLKLWKKTSVIAYGGFIGRAENRTLVQKLEIEALPLGGLDLSDFDMTILVDTQPDAGNHSLPAEIKRDCAIDHHPMRPGTKNLAVFDVREDLGSTCTIVTQYLRKLKVEIGYKLATALFYGLKSDTNNLARETSATDREVYHYLFSRIDHRILSQIENPDLDRDFFETITRAYQGLEFSGPYGWCNLGKITRPDIVAEMADLLIRINDVEWMLCMGYLRNVLYFSIRTKNVKAEAGNVARKILANEKGSAGGHGQMAAGKVEYGAESDELLTRMKKRYLQILAEKEKK